MNWFDGQISHPSSAADTHASGARPNAEAAALARRLSAELRSLRQVEGPARAWYLLIGPGSAGKTTLLASAGLRPATGTGVLSGIGPTRSCAWWHNDDAIVLDTAGRYTTQDSDPTADQAGWFGITDFLRQTRSTSPPAGILLVIPAPILTGQDAPRPQLLQCMQDRVRELQEALGSPVSPDLIITKLDQVGGFAEFFAGLPPPDRAASWRLAVSPDPSSFPGHFQALTCQLERRMFERLEAESSIATRAALMTFPGAFGSLRQSLAALLATIGIRAVYFTAAPERSCFVAHLFNDLLHHGAGSASPAIARRRLAVLVISVLAVVAAGTYLWNTRSGGLRHANAVADTISGFTRLAATLRLDPVTDGDLRPILPMLDQTASSASIADPPPLFGFIRTGDLGSSSHLLYRHALERILLPRLLWRLEAQMRESAARPDVLYETTRIYLMLGGAGPLDTDLVREWLRQDWQALYRRDAALQNALLTHLDNLLATPLPAIPLQNDLIAQARQIFAKVTPAQRAYSRIRLSAAARQAPPWRPGDALGPVGLALFSRSSGRPLSDGVPGFYTVNGFHTVLLPALDSAAQTVVGEAWVTGRQITLQTATIQRDVIRLYEIDYAQTWDTLIADLTIAPLKSVSQAAQDLYVLAAPQSPLRALLAGIARQLTLSHPLHGTPPAPVPGDTAPPGWEIDRRYAALRELMGNGPGAPIDQTLRALNDMQQQFAKAAAAASGLAILAGQPDPAPALRAEALRQPEPLARWLTTLASSGASLRSGVRP